MKRNLVLENYLNHLQEQFAVISAIMLMLVLQMFLYFNFILLKLMEVEILPQLHQTFQIQLQP